MYATQYPDQKCTAPLALGKIGRADQALTPPDPSTECTTDGAELDAEHDGNQGGVDAGEPDGGNNDVDAGEDDQHDDVCQKEDGAEHEADGGTDSQGEH